jgi:S-adenosylmethionine:tRNA ribosyltransferase-isomerase
MGRGVAKGRIGRHTPIRVVDVILTGVHRPGESHFELLEAFTDDAVLVEISEAFSMQGYRPHEFGDSMLIERRRSPRSAGKVTSNIFAKGESMAQKLESP